MQTCDLRKRSHAPSKVTSSSQTCTRSKAFDGDASSNVYLDGDGDKAHVKSSLRWCLSQVLVGVVWLCVACSCLVERVLKEESGFDFECFAAEKRFLIVSSMPAIVIFWSQLRWPGEWKPWPDYVACLSCFAFVCVHQWCALYAPSVTDQASLAVISICGTIFSLWLQSFLVVLILQTFTFTICGHCFIWANRTLFLLTPCVVLWFSLSQPVVRRVEVWLDGLVEEADGYSLCMLSDVHAGVSVGAMTLRTAAEHIGNLGCQTLILNGDIADGTVDARAFVVSELLPAARAAPDGAYYVPGNHEYYNFHAPEGPRVAAVAWTRWWKEHGVQPLNNSRVELPATKRGRKREKKREIENETSGPWFTLVGVDDQEGVQDIDSTLAGVNNHLPCILVAHRPSVIKVARGKVALQLSGHTHGGQVLPLAANPYVWPSRFFSGLYRHYGTWLYVSDGMYGYSFGGRSRLFSTNEITKIILRSSGETHTHTDFNQNIERASWWGTLLFWVLALMYGAAIVRRMWLEFSISCDRSAMVLEVRNRCSLRFRWDAFSTRQMVTVLSVFGGALGIVVGICIAVRVPLEEVTYFGTTDTADQVDRYSDYRVSPPDRRLRVVGLIGGMSILSLLSGLDGNVDDLLLFDMNPKAISIAKLYVELIAISSSRAEFLQRLYARDANDGRSDAQSISIMNMKHLFVDSDVSEKVFTSTARAMAHNPEARYFYESEWAEKVIFAKRSGIPALWPCWPTGRLAKLLWELKGHNGRLHSSIFSRDLVGTLWHGKAGFMKSEKRYASVRSVLLKIKARISFRLANLADDDLSALCARNPNSSSERCRGTTVVFLTNALADSYQLPRFGMLGKRLRKQRLLKSLRYVFPDGGFLVTSQKLVNY